MDGDMVHGIGACRQFEKLGLAISHDRAAHLVVPDLALACL